MREAVDLAERVIAGFSSKGNVDAGAVSGKLRDELSRLMYERTKRSPMIVPVILVV